MSLRAIPVTVLALLFYVFVVLFSGTPDAGTDAASAARALLGAELFSFPMISGARWAFTWGDLILIVTLITLFVEILKATYTSTASLIDHGLSMIVFIVALVLFIVVPKAATSVFFLMVVSFLIDVIAGFTIGIRVAKRDIGFGNGDN